jgi:hypothetical protein
MRPYRAALLSTALTLLTLVIPVSARADGAPDTFNQVTDDQVSAEVIKPLPQGSNASFDKRLPPVIPGEVIDGPGGKIKVWSSAGPLAVATPPSPPTPPAAPALGDGSADVGSVGVFIDRRRGSPSDRIDP